MKNESIGKMFSFVTLEIEIMVNQNFKTDKQACLFIMEFRVVNGGKIQYLLKYVIRSQHEAMNLIFDAV